MRLGHINHHGLIEKPIIQTISSFLPSLPLIESTSKTPYCTTSYKKHSSLYPIVDDGHIGTNTKTAQGPKTIRIRTIHPSEYKFTFK